MLGFDIKEEVCIMSERLTWNEICERYPNCWICLVDIISDDSLYGVKSAVVKKVGKSYTDVKDNRSVKSMVFYNVT